MFCELNMLQNFTKPNEIIILNLRKGTDCLLVVLHFAGWLTTYSKNGRPGPFYIGTSWSNLQWFSVFPYIWDFFLVFQSHNLSCVTSPKTRLFCSPYLARHAMLSEALRDDPNNGKETRNRDQENRRLSCPDGSPNSQNDHCNKCMEISKKN